MQWSDVAKVPTERTLRQFAGLSLMVFGTAATLRIVAHGWGVETWLLIGLAGGLGVIGLIAPSRVRLIYRAWMVAVFPIGWLVSRIMLAVLFFGVFTPVALVFRMMGRDTLRLRRQKTDSYWAAKPQETDVRKYLRQF